MLKLTNEIFSKRVQEIGNGQFIPLENYVNQRTKIKVRHSCGYEWYTLADTIMRKPGCPKCSGNKKKDTKLYKEQVRDIVGQEYVVLNEYKGNKSKVHFLHTKCSAEFFMEAKAFLSGQRCPICKRDHLSKRFRKTHELFVNEVFELVGDEFEVLSQYQRKDTKITMRHTTCQTTFEVTPNSFLSSMESRCPFCKSSKGEKAIEKYLIENSFDFKKQFRIKECKNIRPLPFDFAVFENGKLKLLIEYDGIQHYIPKWGLKEFERTKTNDEIKNHYCNINKIPLFRIPYTTKDIRSELVEIL